SSHIPHPSSFPTSFLTAFSNPDIHPNHPIPSRHWEIIILRDGFSSVDVAESITVGFVFTSKKIIYLRDEAHFLQPFWRDGVHEPYILCEECIKASCNVARVVEVLPAYVFAKKTNFKSFCR